MPPLVAATVAIASTAASAVAAIVPALPAIGAGVGAYTGIKSTIQVEEARSEAASQFRQQMEFTEKQAGEYYQLSSQQMEMQAQASQIQTLANLITEARRPAAPQIFTLPAAKEYSAVEQINQAIDKVLRG